MINRNDRTDISRTSIVFENISDITRCIVALRDDPQLKVLKVKNRMSKDYDSVWSHGYRDVAVNLQIRSAETMKFRCELHIAELQLIHRGFAEKKTDSGHQRYVVLRNLLSE
mmetsp:Transcript_23278/g.36425  ORF Transcript_23278/g.36425 Transcript_23278/m.36425 type:complete len:112 (+) Transcript_23278:1191-1526(+)